MQELLKETFHFSPLPLKLNNYFDKNKTKEKKRLYNILIKLLLN